MSWRTVSFPLRDLQFDGVVVEKPRAKPLVAHSVVYWKQKNDKTPQE